MNRSLGKPSGASPQSYHWSELVEGEYFVTVITPEGHVPAGAHAVRPETVTSVRFSLGERGTLLVRLGRGHPSWVQVHQDGRWVTTATATRITLIDYEEGNPIVGMLDWAEARLRLKPGTYDVSIGSGVGVETHSVEVTRGRESLLELP